MMDIKKFEEVVKKIGGRFKAITIIHKRMQELIESGVLKEKGSQTSINSLEDKILDEILSERVYIEQNDQQKK